MLVNERQVYLRKGGNFTALVDYLDRRKVVGIPFNDTQELAVSSAQYALVDTTEISGTIALGTTTAENGGVVAAALAGAVGNAATTNITDSFGNILNLVNIRDASTNDPILDSNDRVVYGLLQAASTVTDGDAIGAASSENIQLSFVIVGADSALALTTINDTIGFTVNKMYYERNVPTIYKEGGTLERDIVGASMIEPTVRKYVVTTAFAADEVITVSTGAGGVSGASTPSNDSITSLGADAATFNADNRTRVRLNGVQSTKGVEATWDSTTTFHFNTALDIGDRFEIEIAPA